MIKWKALSSQQSSLIHELLCRITTEDSEISQLATFHAGLFFVALKSLFPVNNISYCAPKFVYIMYI